MELRIDGVSMGAASVIGSNPTIKNPGPNVLYGRGGKHFLASYTVFPGGALPHGELVWYWIDRTKGKHTIEAIAYDQTGHTAKLKHTVMVAD
jgi:hypothetical protein